MSTNEKRTINLDLFFLVPLTICIMSNSTQNLGNEKAFSCRDLLLKLSTKPVKGSGKGECCV